MVLKRGGKHAQCKVIKTRGTLVDRRIYTHTKHPLTFSFAEETPWIS